MLALLPKRNKYLPMNDFLSLLKKKNDELAVRNSNCSVRDFYFLIDSDEQGGFVQVVDIQLNLVDPDFRYYTGDVAQTLRTISHIQEERQFRISWESETENDRLHLSDYPYLIYQLIRCDNLLNREKKRVTVVDEMLSIRLFLREVNGEIHPSLRGLPEGESENARMRFLTDSFALIGQRIFPVKALGEGFRQLDVFLAPFGKDMLEEYLSVFYSYVRNMEVVYEDYQVIVSDQVVATVPTLIFEKVDVDKALYLRVTQSLQKISVRFLEDFNVNWLASLTQERQIVLKRIVRSSLDQSIDVLRKLILRYAPDKSAQKEVYQKEGFFIIPPDTASPFLLQALPQLLSDFRLLGADKLREYRVKPVLPRLNLSFSSGIDFLEGDLSLDIEGESFSLNQLLSQYKKQKYISLSDGNRAILDEGYLQRLERVFKNKRGGKVQVSFFDLPEVEDLLKQRLEGEVFVRHRKVYDGFNHLKDQSLKIPNVKAKLRAYQKEGVKWIKYLYDNKLGGCLADDMGLGKTLQAIAVLTLVYPKVKKPSLIVMPRSLLFNWQNELERFAPQLSVYTYYGGQRDMKEALKCQLILTTYAIVRNDVELYSKQAFHYVILDESQNIKNMEAQITQAVLLLNAKHRLALSGTPIENNLTELYSLFRFLNPAMFGSLDEFNARYTLPIQKNNDKEVLLGLRRKIYPFMLRRLKKDVLKELPDRIDTTLYVEMNMEQARLYEQRRTYYYQQVKQTIASDGLQKSQFVMFQALNELRRIASVPESLSDGRIVSPKLEVLMESVTEAVTNGHKVVIFFNYIAGIELVGDKLNEYGIDFTSMTGSTRDRKNVIERFQNDPRCRVLLMTLKTGGVGLNLTAADMVYIFEPWWNKAAEEQAINRLHRFGQTAKVLCFSVLTKGSIEEKICLLQQKKAELFEGLIGSDGSSAKHLSEEDINYILG